MVEPLPFKQLNVGSNPTILNIIVIYNIKENNSKENAV